MPRSDARRNYARILAVAEEEVAARGADASLEQIARTAGVGSATVRRHFPTRPALLEAVFRRQVDALAERARSLEEAADAREALLEWLRALTTYSASARGLATALVRDEESMAHACSATMTDAAEPLVRRAADAGAVGPDVTAADLIAVVTGIVLATEHHRDPAAEAQRLLELAVRGISPPR